MKNSATSFHLCLISLAVYRFGNAYYQASPFWIMARWSVLSPSSLLISPSVFNQLLPTDKAHVHFTFGITLYRMFIGHFTCVLTTKPRSVCFAARLVFCLRNFIVLLLCFVCHSFVQFKSQLQNMSLLTSWTSSGSLTAHTVQSSSRVWWSSTLLSDSCWRHNRPVGHSLLA